MITIMLVLVLAAFVVTIGAAMGYAPLWVAVFLLVMIELIRALPVGH